MSKKECLHQSLNASTTGPWLVSSLLSRNTMTHNDNHPQTLWYVCPHNDTGIHLYTEQSGERAHPWGLLVQDKKALDTIDFYLLTPISKKVNQPAYYSRVSTVDAGKYVCCNVNLDTFKSWEFNKRPRKSYKLFCSIPSVQALYSGICRTSVLSIEYIVNNECEVTGLLCQGTSETL